MPTHTAPLTTQALRAAATLVVALAAAPALSTSPQGALSARQIDTLLTGNTAVGLWEGEPYRQFFGADGVTIYAQDGMRSALGTWRSNPVTNRYESHWPRSGWESWGVSRRGDTLYWTGDHGEAVPFSLVPGQQLVARP